MINKKLYNRLVRRFGDSVKINHENEELEGVYVKDGDRMKLDITRSGEEYVLSCPFCGDRQTRLTINHRWGEFDSVSKSNNLWLAQCYRRQCLADSVNQNRLYEILFSRVHGRKSSLGPVAKPGTTKSAKKKDPYEPGPIWPLSDILATGHGHPIIDYIVDKFYDIDELANTFRVGWVIESDIKFARERLYAPVYMQGQLRSWQCREVKKLFEDAPKWYSMPGCTKSEILYNFDVAVKYKTVVVVEGPSSAWGVGPNAVATFGKSISATQIALLEQHLSDDAIVVLLYDPDRPKNDKNKKHHITKALEKLTKSKLAEKTFPVVLPPGTDPGSLDRDFIWQQIEFSAKKFGFEIDRFSHAEELLPT